MVEEDAGHEPGGGDCTVRKAVGGRWKVSRSREMWMTAHAESGHSESTPGLVEGILGPWSVESGQDSGDRTENDRPTGGSAGLTPPSRRLGQVVPEVDFDLLSIHAVMWRLHRGKAARDTEIGPAHWNEVTMNQPESDAKGTETSHLSPKQQPSSSGVNPTPPWSCASSGE